MITDHTHKRHCITRTPIPFIHQGSRTDINFLPMVDWERDTMYKRCILTSEKSTGVGQYSVRCPILNYS